MYCTVCGSFAGKSGGVGGENLVTLPLKQVLDLPSDSERVRDCLMVPCRVLQNMGNCSPCSLTDIFNQFFPFLSVKIHSKKNTIFKHGAFANYVLLSVLSVLICLIFL